MVLKKKKYTVNKVAEKVVKENKNILGKGTEMVENENNTIAEVTEMVEKENNNTTKVTELVLKENKNTIAKVTEMVLKEINERESDDMATSKQERPLLKMLPNIRKRSTSSMWNLMFDPFQVFEVEHEACLDLEITIKRGETITKGSSLKDLMDTPDPYVIMKIPGSSNPSKRTSHIDNSTNPIWDETFHFYLDPAEEHTLKMILMDANYTLDETLGEDTFCVNSLTNDELIEYTFNFPGGSKIHTTLKLQKNINPDLRFSLALCDAEKSFLQIRRRKVLSAMQTFLGDRAPNNEKQVPIVGILGSGGGFRAMQCMSGVVKALHESGVLDCATYIAGLSGSSWYISTLYAHDKFPNVTHEQIQNELKESVTNDWKWHLTKTPAYISSMISKYKYGQPVSFTDFFGHLLGDVLLKGHKHKKLTDAQRILVQGIVPMPLYTCLHAKRNVSCRSFSEWVEFSPYEIGIAKYGTFMKTEDFGNKFIVGKKIKHFEELPLHFLQGVWGSAFTILIKRLVMEGGNKDIVQIMRDAQKESDTMGDLIDDTHSSGDDSETEDEECIEGRDDMEEDIDIDISKLDVSDGAPPSSNQSHEEDRTSLDTNGNGELELNRTTKSMDSLVSNQEEKEEQRDKCANMFTFNIPKKKTSLDNSRKFSTESDPGVKTEFQTARASRLNRQGAIKGSRMKKQETDEDNRGPKAWAERRKTFRKMRVEKKAGLWEGIKKNIMLGTNLLNSRTGRAGEILNPFRGLSLKHSFPLSPFSPGLEEDEVDAENIGAGCRYEPLDNRAKKLFIVDSGLAFNSPYPLLLRPQRAVDMYLSFDFSQREEDKTPPFKELLLAEKWAIQNKVPFPPIEKQVEQYKNEEPQEFYIFKHPSDSYCPVILHFPLVNNKFREFKAPGVRRETEEEKKFGDFKIFDDPNGSFSSMNFVYEEEQFDHLTKLTEFNTLLGIETIKDELADIIEKKKHDAAPMKNLRDVVNKFKRVSSLHKAAGGRDLKLSISCENETKLKNYMLHNRVNENDESSDEEYCDALTEQDS